MSNPIANKGSATESATVGMFTGGHVFDADLIQRYNASLGERGIVVMKGRSQGPSTLLAGLYYYRAEQQKREAMTRRLNLSLNLPPVAAQKPSIQS